MLESSNAGNPELATEALTTQAAVRTPQETSRASSATLLGFSEIKNRTVAVAMRKVVHAWYDWQSPSEILPIRGSPAARH